MLLCSVRLENFRAVKSARISFEPTTVLIGENDCGRSSVMEAIALALGWNCGGAEFRFQPFHAHLPAGPEHSSGLPISITLEFGESSPGEWDGGGFGPLTGALPDVLDHQRRFWFKATHGGNATHWTFRSAGKASPPDDRRLLDWLRRRMPVFWMTEGMLSSKPAEAISGFLADQNARDLADLVSRQYADLLEGTALDVSAAIEAGSAAASQLLLNRVKLLPDRTTPMGEVLEQITGKRKARSSMSAAEAPRSFGSAAHKIGVLVLVGALLRSGSPGGAQDIDPLTLIENPEAHLHPTTLASIWSMIDRIAGQKIIATHSGTLLACARLSAVRRLTRHAGQVKEWLVPGDALSGDELRRYSYHLRSRRASASFARCWLLVEGETEFWLMSELARVCGYDFASEGVACVEFAQCGLGVLVKVARCLGIEWHLLTDGDEAGQDYAHSARHLAGNSRLQDRITVLMERDVEHCFWKHGYEDVFRKAAYPRDFSSATAPCRRIPAKAVISRAIDRRSKPYLAALLLDAAIDRGPTGIPPSLKSVVETCIRLARHGSAR